MEIAGISNKKKMIIGITGEIGSGKSTITEYFVNKGFENINVDRIGHHLLYNKNIQKEICKYFGDSWLENGIPNRKILASLVFSSPHQVQKLNGIVHPYIYREVEQRVKLISKGIIDAALLFEMKLNQLCNIVVLVVANKDIRRERLRRIGKEDFLKREQYFMPLEYKKKMLIS